MVFSARFRRVGALLSLSALLLAGCATQRQATASGAPLARQVTASEHCGLTAPGLVYLTSADEVRALSGLPGQAINLSSMAALDFSREHLLLVALGQRSTGGYGLTLAASEQLGDTLQLEMDVYRPAPDAMVTQVITTPCTALAVTASGWRTVTVHGEGLPTLSRSR